MTNTQGSGASSLQARLGGMARYSSIKNFVQRLGPSHQWQFATLCTGRFQSPQTSAVPNVVPVLNNVSSQVSSPDELEQCDEETLAALLSTDAKVQIQLRVATSHMYRQSVALQTVMVHFAVVSHVRSFILVTAEVITLLHHRHYACSPDCAGRLSRPAEPPSQCATGHRQVQHEHMTL